MLYEGFTNLERILTWVCEQVLGNTLSLWCHGFSLFLDKQPFRTTAHKGVRKSAEGKKYGQWYVAGVFRTDNLPSVVKLKRRFFVCFQILSCWGTI